MKNKIFLWIMILFSKFTIAQNPYLDYKYAFKISNLSTLKIKQVTPEYSSSPYALSFADYSNVSNQLQLLHPTFAFDWMTKRKNTQEIELVDLVLNRANTQKYVYISNGVSKLFTDKTIETAISLRYEYLINFCTQKESKWVPSLGFSFNPYYQLTRSAVSNTFSYHTGMHTLGIRAAVNPRLTYFFSKNLFLTAGLSFTMLDVSESTFLNPAAVVKSYQKDRQTNYNFKGVKDLLEFRIGLGYKF